LWAERKYLPEGCTQKLEGPLWYEDAMGAGFVNAVIRFFGKKGDGSNYGY
jgi:hypothetical protein